MKHIWVLAIDGDIHPKSFSWAGMDRFIDELRDSEGWKCKSESEDCVQVWVWDNHYQFQRVEIYDEK